MRRFVLPTFLALILASGLWAQSQQGVLIPWGKAESQLGLYQDGDYLRGPAFFSVDEQGNYYIADAYKARVAVFDVSGRFLKSVPLPDISPRTTFFKRTEDGSFVVSNDQQLSRWSAQGDQLGRVEIGLLLPLAYYATAQSLILWLQQSDGESCRVFSRDLSKESLLSMKTAHGSVAAFKDDSGTYWFPRWTEQVALYRWKASLPLQAQLTERTREGSSLWLVRGDTGIAISRVDAKGELITEERLPTVQPAQFRAIIAIGPALTAYYAFFELQGFRIETLTLRNR